MRAVMALATRVLVLHHGAAIARGHARGRWCAIRRWSILSRRGGASDARRVENLDVFYGDAQALDGVSLEVAEGAIVAIVGANGAGKTSLIRTIAGMHAAARAAAIRCRGSDIAGLASRTASAISASARSPRAARCSRRSRVAENLEMGAMLPRARAERGAAISSACSRMFPRLAERTRQAAGTLSGGEQQMLAIGRCLMGEPELVMFDEPSLGLAPAVVQDVLQTIRDLNRAGADLRAGRAERRGVAQAREPRLCAGERPDHAVGHRRGACWPTTGCGRPISGCSAKHFRVMCSPHRRWAPSPHQGVYARLRRAMGRGLGS